MLVIRGGAIGDFILTLPAFAALRQTFPETHVEALGYPHLAELAKTAGIIDGYKSIESGPLAGFFGRNTILNEAWMEYFSSFHLIVSYLYDPDGIFQTNVGRSSKAQFLKGPHRPDETLSAHATEVFLQPLQQLAIFEPEPIPNLRLPRVANEPSGQRTSKKIAIHPGSGSQKKNWPLSGWLEAIKLICSETDWQILVVGGEAELAMAGQLASAAPRERLQMALGQPLLATAEAISRCDLFLGHDSGITHLAAALGIPLLALWGPSRFDIWKPLGSHCSFIHAGENLALLPVLQVFETAKRMMRE
jgi:heptosyltransferase-2